MPGFNISGVGGNRTSAPVDARFYTSFSWEIPSLFQNENQSSSSSNGNNNDALLLLKSASLPSVKFEQEKARGAAFEYKYAGGAVFDDVKVVWYDSHGLNDSIKAWKESVFSIDTGIQAANVYKKKTIISKYLVDRDDFVPPPEAQGGEISGNQDYHLFGSWPQMIKESDLTYVEASIKSIEIVICYDYFKILQE